METETKILQAIVDYLKYYDYTETELKNDIITLDPGTIVIQNQKISISFIPDTEATEEALIAKLVGEAVAPFENYPIEVSQVA